MKIEKLNEILSDLSEYGLDKKFNKVSEDIPNSYYAEKNQGDEGEKVLIYDLGEDNTFLKVVFTSDSYGSENGISSIQFVKPITKEVTVYE